MESAGFVERRADASDGRTRRVYLTRAGTKLVTTIRKSVEDIELQILDKISEDALNQASTTLLTIKDTLLEIAASEGYAPGPDPDYIT